jgi:hypothetical protein
VVCTDPGASAVRSINDPTVGERDTCVGPCLERKMLVALLAKVPRGNLDVDVEVFILESADLATLKPMIGTAIQVSGSA